MKVLLITGGTSNEASISRNSCTNIRKMLDNTKYDIDTVVIDESGVWYKLSDSINDYTVNNWLANASTISDLYSFIKLYDVVFPVLHGKNGEDGTIQGLLELINVPYVGCKVLSSALCMDKVTTKRVLESFNINVAPYLFVKKIKGKYYVETKEGELLQDFGELVEREIGYPCFVKASRSGSSVGCFKLKDKSSLKSTLDKVGEVDTRILIEKAIIGKELECGILGNNELIISEVGQIIPHGDFYSYQAKYFDSKYSTSGYFL